MSGFGKSGHICLKYKHIYFKLDIINTYTTPHLYYNVYTKPLHMYTVTEAQHTHTHMHADTLLYINTHIV